MISDSMFHYITSLASRASEDSLVHTITNWIALGCYTGFRKSEWCSDYHDSFATIDNPNWGDQPAALPVIASNFTFTTKSRRCVKDLVTSTDNTIVFVLLCFCKQKNNNNGQSLTYSHQRNTTWLCPTQAGLNIVR